MKEGMKKSRRGGKNIKLKACVAVAVFCAGIYVSVKVQAYEEVTQIDVTVGYWGMEVYTKGTATLEELAANCGTSREIYTWIDNKPAAGTTEAEGVYLSDIMDYFGIDTNSVSFYNFYTLDAASYAGAWENWSSDNLLGGRYTLKECFQNALDDFNAAGLDEFNANPENHWKLTDFYNCAESTSDASYLPNAWQKRLAVQPMLALSKNSVRWEGPYPCAFLDYAGMTSESMPQLMFGQNAVNDVGRSNMAKMVTKIHIWFEGFPSITGDLSDMEGKVGSSTRVNIDVNTPDAYLTQMIKANIKWTSDDESVATVDDDGNVTFVGEGTASISAVYTYQDDKGNKKEFVGYTAGVTSEAGTDDEGENGGQEENQQVDDNNNEPESGEKNQEDKQEDKIRGTADNMTGSGGRDKTVTGKHKTGDDNSGGHSITGDREGSKDEDGNKLNFSERYYLADRTADAAETKKEEIDKAEDGEEKADNQLQAALADVDSGGGNLKVYEVKDTIRELTEKELPEIEKPAPVKTAGALAAALLAAGIFGEGVHFRREKKKG